MSYGDTDTLDWHVIHAADKWLDSAVSADYLAQPLAQDWARVGKVIEELGEAITELIAATGQNPRKSQHLGSAGRLIASERMLKELGDIVVTGILGIQHFTKDTRVTKEIIRLAVTKVQGRIPDEIS